MEVGISYLEQARQTGHASIFEAIYAIATEINNWPAAARVIVDLCKSGEISCGRSFQFIKAVDNYNAEPITSDERDIFEYKFSTYTTIRKYIEICGGLPKLEEIAEDPDQCRDLSKYKIVDGTPICGIRELDDHILTPYEINLITEGLRGPIMRALTNSLLIEHSKAITAKELRINALLERLESHDKNNDEKEMAGKSRAFAGQTILACARRLIGVEKSLAMSDRQIANRLLEILADEDGNKIASERTMIDYIQVGRRKE